MKTIICNICKEPMTHTARGGFQFACMLHERDSDGPGGTVREANYAFDASAKVETFKFNCTDFDVCNQCLLSAIKEGIAKL